jgi:hypothetical protein
MTMPRSARMLVTACAVVALLLAFGAVAPAQVRTGGGLITAVDLATNTLTLETRAGSQQVRVAPIATILGDRDNMLSIRDLRPGDAVSYETAADSTMTLRVARQFWAVPRGW